MNRPNIIVIHSHDLGDYLGCYNSPISTPNIDSLAEEGAIFNNHFSTGTICCPSRGSLWTGCYPHSHGLMGLVPRGWELNVEKCPHLAEILKNNGYETALFGLQHEHWDSHRLGYDEVYGESPYYCDEVTPIFLDWMSSQASKQPFFASIGFFDPHRIGNASQGVSPENLGEPPSHFKRPEYDPPDSDSVEVRPYLVDNETQRKELADFYGAVKLVDKMVGQIIGALKEKGLYDDTIVIFTTDHGASFMHSKGTLYDGGTKVAFLIRWPEGIPAGTKVESLTSHVDFVPTLRKWLGIDLPKHVEGQSFDELIERDSIKAREFIFAEKNYTQYFDPARMVRSDRYKFIVNGLRKSIYDFVLTEIEMSSSSFRQNKEVYSYYSSERVFDELYDLENDPGEMKNLATDPEYQNIVEKYRGELVTHMRRTKDPFLKFQNDILMPADVYTDVIRTKF